jgi:hypothetical protein
MNQDFQNIILNVSGATEVTAMETIQSLWSGYGKIMRFTLKSAQQKSLIVKHVKLPDNRRHPRGWNTDVSHQRKVKSYKVESAWYGSWSKKCDETCRVPHCLAVSSTENETLMVLEDLDASGYPSRKSCVSQIEMKACISWLANFHAIFMGESPENLWAQGTYWHLATRPDELQVLSDLPLKKAAKAIDQKLNSSPYKTFVHGDAKLANFCFSSDGKKVSAVDFQYVGGGCGMKDLAYFVGSCLDEDQSERQEAEILNFYFSELKQALAVHKKTLDFSSLEQDWRRLYPVAWTDFHRFLKGWSPGHWKINSYSERLTREVLAEINS